MKFLYLIWSNLKRKKLRTILTILSILVAFLLYGFLSALKQAFTAGATIADADRLVVRHKVSIIQTLPVTYKTRMLAIPGVDAVSHQTWFGGIYQEPKNFFASMPVEPEEFLSIYPEFVVSPEHKKAWLETRTGAIVGRDLAKRFGWKIGDRVPLMSPIWQREGGANNWEFEIVGFYDAGKKGVDTTQFFFRYDYFDEARAFVKGAVGWYLVRVKNPDQAAEIAKKIDAEFSNSPAETKAEPEGAFAQGFAEQIGNIGKIMIAILSAVFFTILLVAGNTMAQAVRERTEELGVLKAMGFSNELVLGLVLSEACLIAGLGGLGGLGLVLAILAGGSPVPQIFPIFYVTTRDVVIGVVLTFALGVITGMVPAWQAMRLRVAEALRRQA
jgi:putative ABC transport system permease protein